MEDGLGNTYMRYSQQYKGVPVYGSDIIVGVNQNDEVDFMNGGYAPNLEIDVQPVVRSIEAEHTALDDLGLEDGKLHGFGVFRQARAQFFHQRRAQVVADFLAVHGLIECAQMQK